MKRAACLFAGLAALLLAGPAAGQQTYSAKSGLQVTDLSFSPSAWTHGTVEHRFVIENPSPQRRTVTVELPGNRYSSWRNGIGSLAGSVTVEAGSRATLSLIQPPMGLDGDATFAVSEKSVKRETFACRARDFQDYRSEESVSVLLSKSLSAEALSERVTACSPQPSSRPVRSGRSPQADKVESLRLEREPAAWPENWLAYTGFDGCLLDAADYGRMPEEARNGLRAYVAAGGAVTFLGVSAAPSGWCEPEGAWKPAWRTPGLFETPFGFGRVQVLDAKSVAGLASNQVVSLARTWAERKAPWGAEAAHSHSGGSVAYSFERCLEDIPVRGGAKVPVNLFLFTLLAFVLVAGPGAVIYAARANRRIWLLAIVPAVSLAFSGAIFAAALAAEGVTPYVRRQAVTLLDQTRRQAATLGALSVYAPTSLGRGLAFDRGTEVTPLSYSRNQDYKRVVWGQEQLFAEGWVRPRMAAFFRVRRSEERSERLVVAERGSNSVEVVNALGAPVRRLWLNDGRGGVYSAEGLAPGEKRLLTVSPASAKAQPEAVQKVRAFYDSASPGWGLAAALKTALPHPGPRTYVAVLDGCPFLENPLRDRQAKESAEALVAGRF